MLSLAIKDMFFKTEHNFIEKRQTKIHNGLSWFSIFTGIFYKSLLFYISLKVILTKLKKCAQAMQLQSIVKTLQTFYSITEVVYFYYKMPFNVFFNILHLLFTLKQNLFLGGHNYVRVILASFKFFYQT